MEDLNQKEQEVNSEKQKNLLDLKDKYLGEIGSLKRHKGDETFEQDFEKEIIAERIAATYFINNLRNRDMCVKAMFELIEAIKDIKVINKRAKNK